MSSLRLPLTVHADFVEALLVSRTFDPFGRLMIKANGKGEISPKSRQKILGKLQPVGEAVSRRGWCR
jgi:hypothetical protein